jgi:acetyl-CoA C-acetyltransferase
MLVEEVVLGCVLQAGLGQSQARQSAIAAGIPKGGALDDDQHAVGIGPEVG